MSGLTEISDWFVALGNDTERLRLLFVSLIGLVGFSLVLAISIFTNAILNPVKKRIDEVQNEEGPKSTKHNIHQLLQQLGAFLIPKAEEKRSKLAYQLETAGYRSSRAMAYFYGIKLIGFIVAPILVMGGIALFTNRPVLNDLSLATLAGAIAFLAPNLWLARKVRKRQQQLRHALPDALDLMVVCSEAGLGLNAAIKRVADEIGVQHPELADELQLVMMQTRAGMDNRSALKELERRTGLDDISAFVTTLLQAMRFGTSISQSLRVFSDEMRDKRLQRAQEKAARLSLTMLMPIVLCMLPMFFLILLGPSMLSLMQTIGKMTNGVGG
jgi:tight adherence protein C